MHRRRVHRDELQEHPGRLRRVSRLLSASVTDAPPRIVQEIAQLTSVATFVAAGVGVAIVPAALAQVKVRGVAYVAIRGRAPVAGLAIATRLGEETPVVDQFLEIVRIGR